MSARYLIAVTETERDAIRAAIGNIDPTVRESPRERASLAAMDRVLDKLRAAPRYEPLAGAAARLAGMVEAGEDMGLASENAARLIRRWLA